jgi:aerobic-type carbon monoxide dehydrogenase small subunit (CoxS/CutS family)
MHQKNDTNDLRRPSRRGFLKGAGVAAAGAAIGEGALTAMGQEAQARGPEVLGPGTARITLKVNGADKNIEVEPRTTLAEALRVHADLTGTKVVCDRGACSACTVFIDGKPQLSCMTLALDAVEKQITTIEGLAKGDQLHPVQEEFIAHDAMQCGFCTPGMVMSCAGLLNRKRNPTLDDVKDAVRGNLCRCGTYPKVFDATLAAAQKMSGTANT